MIVRGGVALPTFARGRQFVRVGVRDEHQNLGIGEASPLPPHEGDVASALAALLLDAIADLAPLAEALPLREAVLLAMAPVEERLASSNAARFALETALLDLACVRRGVTLAEGLSGGPGFAEIPYNVLLDASKGGFGLRAMEIARESAIRAVKVKLRAVGEAAFLRELTELWALRAILPPPFELRLDPNGAWTLQEAREKLGRLAPLLPHYVEQPVPAKLLPRLGPTHVPWAADESLCVPGLAEELAGSLGCQAFILKPAALGGITKALALAELGARFEHDLVVTHFMDGPVGIAAASEFARALPKMPLACGLDRHPELESFPNLQSPHHQRRGVISTPSGIGLGFSMEERNAWLSMG